MQTLSKAAIVAVVDIQTEIVQVPEWGGAVAVRELTGTERDAFEQSMVRVDTAGKRHTDLGNMRAKLCAWCIVDGESGDRLFADDHLAELGNKSAVALDRIFRVAQRINGMGATEDVEKNSAPDPSASSTFA